MGRGMRRAYPHRLNGVQNCVDYMNQQRRGHGNEKTNTHNSQKRDHHKNEDNSSLVTSLQKLFIYFIFVHVIKYVTL